MQDFATRRTMMVDTQVRPNDVTKFPIIEAMLAVPREDFVPPARREAAYIGENVPLAPGRVLLEPRSFAKMLDALDIQPSDLVLELQDARDGDIGSILAWGFAPYTGGCVSYMDLIWGVPAFVAEADRLADKYGERFRPGKLLREMAEKGQSFYDRFPPAGEKKAAA